MKTLSDFETIAKRHKRKNRLKIILASVVMSLLSLLLLLKIGTEVTSNHGRKISQTYFLMSEIAYPNIYANNWTFAATSQFTGIFESDRYKNIDGISLPYEKMTSYYSLTDYQLEDKAVWLTSADAKKSAYTHGNLYKSPLFFNINHDYTSQDQYQVTQDISMLSQMTGQAVEVAVTFDKPYTIKEIAELVPDNLLINWYWIGSSSNYDTAELNPAAQLGIKVYDDESLSQNEFETFSTNLNSALSEGYLDQTYASGTSTALDLAEDTKTYLKSNTSWERASFSGLILTGRAENFKSLEKANWIYASNIGQSVQIQPYNQLTK